MRARFVVPCVTLAIVLGEAKLGAQGEVTSAPIGAGYSNFSLACPFSMVMIGATSPNALPQTLRCSLYRADGHRFGPVITQDLPATTNPRVELIDSRPSIARPPVTVDCPNDRAVTSFRVYQDTDPHGLGVIYLELYCAGIGAGGGQTVSTKAGSLPGGINVSDPNAWLTCPGQKFVRGFTGVNGGLALLCIDAPVMATTIGSVGLAAQHVVSGTAVAGTATLNGYAAGTTSITMSVTGAPGASVTSPLVVPDGAHSATFQVQSAPSTAGCGTVKATVGATTVSGPLFFTPAPPSGASFAFALQPDSPVLTWEAPSTITAMVVIPTSKGIGAIGVIKRSPSVTFQSDRPDLLAIQASTQRIVGDTTKVTMSALAGGCAVVTATVDGVMWRKTLKLAAGF
jgi:hypothetical protein